MQATCEIDALLPRVFQEQIGDKDELERIEGVWRIYDLGPKLGKYVEDCLLKEFIVLCEI